MIQNTRHTGLVVQDLDRSLNFYQSLGLTLWKRETETGAFIETVVGLPKARVEWAKLRAPDGSLVELLQYHSHPTCQILEKAPPNLPGCSHIAFTVKDIDSFCDLICHLGGSIVNQPATDPTGGVKVSYAHDPDGILIEVVEEIDQLV